MASFLSVADALHDTQASRRQSLKLLPSSYRHDEVFSFGVAKKDAKFSEGKGHR
jgi:hypothetical protein